MTEDDYTQTTWITSGAPYREGSYEHGFCLSRSQYQEEG